MASRNVFALLLVAICAVGAVAASEAEGRRALRMFPGFPQPQPPQQPQQGLFGFPGQQPQQPGFPQQPQQGGYPQQLPQQPGFPQNHQQIPHQVFPQFQEQPTPLDFHSHTKGCARNHVIKMSMYGLACLPDTRTSSHHSYPARDDLSKKLCPYNFLYRLVDNVHPACLPESYVYDGVWEVQVHGD